MTTESSTDVIEPKRLGRRTNAAIEAMRMAANTPASSPVSAPVNSTTSSTENSAESVGISTAITTAATAERPAAGDILEQQTTVAVPADLTVATVAVAPVAAATPLAQIQAAIDAIPESEMATWAIEILCQSTVATQFRPLFRAAAEHPDGEARVYRLLQVMIKNGNKLHHNQLRMAATQSVAAARSNGRGILAGTKSEHLLSAAELSYQVAHAAKNNCRLQDLDQAAPPVEND
ncbi:MAG: hypothetical protein V4719_14670 [Planctomycetota bacterium]